MNKIDNLNGNSGNALTILQKNDRRVVHKSSQSIANNKRLIEQYKKHNYFLENSPSIFKVPKIISSGYENGLFYFEYEYVDGISLKEFVETRSQGEVHKIVCRIIEALIASKQIAPYEKHVESFKTSIFKKIIKNNQFIGLHQSHISKLERLIGNLPDISSTFSHGDFTLDNIIIDKDLNLWLIDITDLFYSHYWLDLSKLFQFYYFGAEGTPGHLEVNQEEKSALVRSILTTVNRLDQDYENFHNLLCAISLIRIYPYLKTENSKIFAKNQIIKLIEESEHAV